MLGTESCTVARNQPEMGRFVAALALVVAGIFGVVCAFLLALEIAKAVTRPTSARHNAGGGK